MFLRSGKQCGIEPSQIDGMSLNVNTGTRAKNNKNTAKDMSNGAVLNPDVLDIIFAQLNVPDLKAARLVCRQWRDAASTLLGKSTFLTACKLFHVSDNKLSRVAYVDNKLTRRVFTSSETGNFDRSIPIKKRANVVSKVISTIVSPLTQDLTVRIDRKKCVTPVLQGIKKLKTSNLRNVVCVITIRTDWGDKAPALAYDKLPVQASLTSIKFEIFSDLEWTPINPNIYLSVQPILKGWLDSAPNLTSLDIFVNFFPNLEGCINLKVFKFQFNRRLPPGEIDLGAVTRMLTQIKDSVEHVELDFDRCLTLTGPTFIGQLDFPVMPHVVTFFANEVYKILDTLDEHCLPKLKHLKLEESRHEERGFDSTKLWKGHRGIESFTLTMLMSCRCDQFPETIVKLFPSVKKFDFTWKVFSTVNSEHLNWFMRPFKFWNLDVAKVSLKHVLLSGNLVGAMRSMSTWSGVKMVKFSAYLRKDSLTDLIEDVIDLSSGFKTVEIEVLSVFRNVPIEDEFMDKMRSRIAARRAPISLKKE